MRQDRPTENEQSLENYVKGRARGRVVAAPAGAGLREEKGGTSSGLRGHRAHDAGAGTRLRVATVPPIRIELIAPHDLWVNRDIGTSQIFFAHRTNDLTKKLEKVGPFGFREM